MRLLKAAEGARPMLLGFESNDAAAGCVAAIIAPASFPGTRIHGPAGDPCLRAFRRRRHPLDVEALLIVEVQGSEDEIDTLLEKIGDAPATLIRR